MGPSGSGKSTLMHCCAALDTADRGSVFIGEQDLTKLKDKGLTRLRRDEIGFVFQSFNLVPTLTAEENITLPMAIAGRKPDQEWYDNVISTVGLGDRLKHKPNELSGGQQQRVAVARALASRPRIVFADEPTGNLDSRSGAEVLELLRRSVDDHGQTVVMVTHDPVAAAYTDRVVFLADGRVVDELRDPTREQVLEVMNRMAEQTHERSMIKAALKSLLGRKVRLLMSTFAIVLGVAFVAGSLIFSDTLSRSFTALFASTVGDVVVRPEGGTTADGAPSTVTLPGEPGRAAARRARRGPGRRQRQRVRRLRRQQGRQGRQRVRPAGDRRQLVRRARGPRAPGARDRRGPRAARPRRGGLRRAHGRARRVRRRRPGRHHPVDRGRAADRRPSRPHPPGSSRRWWASPASRAAARSTARRTPPSTPRPPRTSSSAARTPTPTSG